MLSPENRSHFVRVVWEDQHLRAARMHRNKQWLAIRSGKVRMARNHDMITRIWTKATSLRG